MVEWGNTIPSRPYRRRYSNNWVSEMAVLMAVLMWPIDVRLTTQRLNATFSCKSWPVYALEHLVRMA